LNQFAVYSGISSGDYVTYYQEPLAGLKTVVNIVLLISTLSLSKLAKNYDEIVTIWCAKAVKVPKFLTVFKVLGHYRGKIRRRQFVTPLLKLW